MQKVARGVHPVWFSAHTTIGTIKSETFSIFEIIDLTFALSLFLATGTHTPHAPAASAQAPMRFPGRHWASTYLQVVFAELALRNLCFARLFLCHYRRRRVWEGGTGGQQGAVVYPVACSL